MGNVVESAWTNNPTKRCVVKFSNTLSEGIVTNILKNNPLDAVSVMQLVTAYNQTVFANNMLLLNNIFKKN